MGDICTKGGKRMDMWTGRIDHNSQIFSSLALTVNKLNIIHTSSLDVMSHIKFLSTSLSRTVDLTLLLFLTEVRTVLKISVHQCMHRYTERII